jgi:hypothetical protein
MLHPEWVILGVQGPASVMVYASSVLSEAELEAHIEEGRFVGDWRGPSGVRSMTLRIEIGPRQGEAILWRAVGATYADVDVVRDRADRRVRRPDERVRRHGGRSS